jgi:hypothetical protein
MGDGAMGLGTDTGLPTVLLTSYLDLLTIPSDALPVVLDFEFGRLCSV